MLHIISYNILGTSEIETQGKVETVLGKMPADVWILAEIFENTRVPEGFRLFWMGEKGIKGLGIIVRKGLEASAIKADGLAKYCIPLEVGGKIIVAMWPTRIFGTKNTPYPRLFDANLRALESLITSRPTLIAGDMNCYPGQSGETKSCNIKTIANWLKVRGFASAYHDATGENIGEESRQTLDFQNRHKSFFHIDYAFANAPVENFRLIDWQESPVQSDHCCLSLDF